MADSVFTTLLENIQVDLAAVSGLTNNTANTTRYVSAVFTPLHGEVVPYAVITPGPCGKEGADNRVDLQQVLIHVVHGIYSDPADYYTVLGTSSAAGLMTLMEAVEAALARSRPYNDGDHVTGSGYTTLPTVQTGYALGWTAPQQAEVETPELYLVQTLTLEYRIGKGA